MTYATQQDLIDRYGADELAQLTDRAAATTIDAVVVNRALADADSEIDSFLARRVTTPLSPAPQIVKAHACAIARFRLHKDHAPEHVRDAYKDAIAWLNKAAAGSISIDGLPTPEGATTADMPIVDAPARIFGRDAMRGF